MDNPKPRVIVYLVTEDWYFVSHRLPMARAAKKAGYEVHVAARVVDFREQIEREGFVLHPIPWSRGSLSLLRTIVTILAVRNLYRGLRPNIVHHVALAPSIVGSIAALGMATAKINALAGLGFIFSSDTFKARLLRPFVSRLLGFLLRRPNSFVLVQNPDDALMVAQLGVAKNCVTIIPGSGVDVDHLTPLPEPDSRFAVGFVGRLLYDKGVATLIRAHEILNQRGVNIRTLIAGTPDPRNPASIPAAVLEKWRQCEGVVLLGQVDDIRTVWAKAHVAVLPSLREGLPLSLLEAAACGRPIVATDVPGCREIARADVNALLVPPQDPEALADAIQRLATNAEMRRRFGAASRMLVEKEFSRTTGRA